jgi:CHAT domain-containing protein
MSAEQGVRVPIFGPVEDPTAAKGLQELLAELAQRPSQEVPQALFAFPILLSEPGVELARACSRRSGGALATLVDQIEHVRGVVEEDDERWELGNGPFESLFGSVDVELSVEAATTIASTPAVRSQLSLPYVQALCRMARSFCSMGQPAAAVKMQCLLLAATNEQPVDEEEWALRSEVIATELNVVRTAATSSEDRRTIASGIERADRFLEQARQRGDRAAQAMALHGIAQVLIEPRFPWATGSRMAILRVLRLARNIDEQLADPVRQLSADNDAPSDAELTAKGVDCLKAAFALAEGERRGLIAHTLGSLAAHPHREEGSGIEEIDGAYFARVVLEEIKEESLRRLRLNACSILSNLDEPWPAAELEEVLAMTPSRLLSAVEAAEAAQMIVLAISLSRAEVQEAAALRLAVGSYERLRELTDEDLWLRVLRMMIGLLMALGPDVRLIDDESAAARRVRQLLNRAFDTEEHRVFAEGAKTAIAKLKPGEKTGEDEMNEVTALARASVKQAPRGQVPSLLDLDEGLALELPRAYRDSLLYSRASLQGDIAVARHHQGDVAGAAADIIESAECWSRLGALDAAGEAVQMFSRIAMVEPTTADLKAIVAALGPAGLRLESLLGHGGQEVMTSTWETVVRALLKIVMETQSDPEVGILHTVVSAGRHSARRRSRAPVDPISFVEALKSAQSFIDKVRLPSAAPEALIDADAEQMSLEVAACSRYVQRPPVSTAFSPAAESDNLKRYFDWQFCSTELAAKAAAPTEPDPDLACLGSTGVLIEGFLTAHQSKPTILAAVSTDNGLQAVMPLIPNGLEGMLVEVAGQLDLIGPLQTIAMQARLAAQQHSGPREVTAEAAETLSTNWLLGESADSTLATLAEQGKRRLYVVAPDAFAFAPLHLSGAAGHPLAERWQISYLPDASWLRPTAPSGRRETLGALGLDFAALALPTLEDAVAEAEEIAAIFGGNVLLNARATVQAARGTLADCTVVHFATHGAFDPAAPSFQRLYLSDGNEGMAHLFASDLYDLDLRHVRLVTLGACETALGRIDVGGNQRGFVGALLQRGVKTVVAALWRVNSGCSRLFFAELYRHLAAGSDCHVAFSAAQASARASYRSYRQWGAFVLIGGVDD